MRRWVGLFVLISLFCSVVSAQDSTPQPEYFVEAFVDNPTPYVGQQLTYIFRFYDAADTSQPEYEPPDFEGFWQIADQQVESNAQQINGRQYIVSEVRTTLYPTRAGNITIEPSHVLLPETVYRSADEMATQPISVQVNSLPDGAPEGFTGAVGEFALSATLDRQSAPLGEPITLRLVVSGTGNVEQLLLPDLPVPDSWRVYDSQVSFRTDLVNGEVVGEKQYAYLLIPDQVGSQTLPSITLIYFDPTSMVYRSVTTSSVTLEVLPGATTTQPTQESVPERVILGLKPVPTPIQDYPTYPGLVFWMLWLLPPCTAVLCGAYAIRRDRQIRKLSITRRSRALIEAQKCLHEARKASSDKGYALLRTAIVVYLAHKLDAYPDRLSDWHLLLVSAPVPPSLKEKLTLCLEWTDEGKYAPNASFTLSALSGRVEAVLHEIDAIWKSP